MSNLSTYRANGKLLLTGEYLVLHGAKAIALPLKVGQQLFVSEKHTSGSLIWKAVYKDQIWLSCELNPANFSVLRASHPGKAETLRNIFSAIQSIRPDFDPKPGTAFETILESNPEWGFGSSSTLISILSQWAGVNPFELNKLVFKGSGFDIACATANGPISYIKNEPAQSIELEYPFSGQLFFLYSGTKKKTATEVKSFLKDVMVSPGLVAEVSALTDGFAICQEQKEFNRLIRQHEELIGKLIGKTTVKSEYFADFKGEVKSLGAWGGDFYLVSTELPLPEVTKYFENKGLTTLFQWSDLILKRKKQ